MTETLRVLSRNVDRVVNAYASQWSTYDNFALNLASLVRDQMGKVGVEFHDVVYRAKSVDSFREKIKRQGKVYLNPLKEVTDLAGVRIILYYEEDVRKACKVLEKMFFVERSQSENKAKLLADDQFGYRDVHYVVKLSKHHLAMSDWAGYKGLKAELQVRTILQHAWDAISHKLQYKQEIHTPRQDQRRLARLAALLELADDEFNDLKRQAITKSRSIRRKLSQKLYGLEVNIESVTEYVRRSVVVAQILAKFRAHGFQVIEQLANASQLTSVAIGMHLSTIASLDSALKKSLTGLQDFLPVFIDKNFGEDKNKWRVFPAGGDSDHWAAVALLQSVTKRLDRQRVRNSVSWCEEYFDAVMSASNRKSSRRRPRS